MGLLCIFTRRMLAGAPVCFWRDRHGSPHEVVMQGCIPLHCCLSVNLRHSIRPTPRRGRGFQLWAPVHLVHSTCRRRLTGPVVMELDGGGGNPQHAGREPGELRVPDRRRGADRVPEPVRPGALPETAAGQPADPVANVLRRGRCGQPGDGTGSYTEICLMAPSTASRRLWAPIGRFPVPSPGNKEHAVGGRPSAAGTP